MNERSERINELPSRWKEWDHMVQGFAKEVGELGASVLYSKGAHYQEEAGSRGQGNQSERI